MSPKTAFLTLQHVMARCACSVSQTAVCVLAAMRNVGRPPWQIAAWGFLCLCKQMQPCACAVRPPVPVTTVAATGSAGFFNTCAIL